MPKLQTHDHLYKNVLLRSKCSIFHNTCILKNLVFQRRQKVLLLSKGLKNNHNFLLKNFANHVLIIISLQIWNGSNKVKNIDVQAAEKHGKIYDADGKMI